MSNDDEQLIPPDIRPYLREIAERLWSGHAAVMIGAGFSKNAKKSDPSKKDFPDWSQLGDVFYEKIYGCRPSDKHHYLNVLKLADEIQAAFGRPVLDQILRSQIPDEDHEPSELHIKLMELPWSDVFTTNYDTLLERTRANIVSQRFDVVVNKEDLVYSGRPRIIKLHGSLPSERPFIITEEDYRKYPKEFAPFVNTVQQSLLENTLCLIGFSGDDPNFLQWIGWIRDNLGKDNSPKMYLIGLLNLSDAQKKLLERRNIVVLDLSSCHGVGRDHARALTVFLDFLHSAKKVENSLEWPDTPQVMYPKQNEDRLEQVKTVITSWKTARMNYPNWAILPEDRRNMLWTYTEGWVPLLYRISEFGEPIDIEFLFEFNWRLEKCLCRIFSDLITSYEAVLERYNPLPGVVTIEKAQTPSNAAEGESHWKEITPKWLELHLSVMRFYREEGLLDKWNAMNGRLAQLYHFLSPELVARLHYERCLYFLFSLDLSGLRVQIKEWPSNNSLPLWEAKRAGLLAELGDLEEAEQILEKSLSFIREQLNLSPVSDDYSWVSQEAHVMQSLQYVKRAIVFAAGHVGQKEEVKERFIERWNDLRRYKCDPWNELKLFETHLEREPVPFSSVTKRHEFDIGRVTVSTTYHSGISDKEAFRAFSFLRYCEDIGIPFRIPRMTFGKKAAQGTLKRISNYSSYWAFATLIRLGDSEVVDTIFNRQSISRMDISDTDRLIERYLAVIEGVLPEIESGDKFRKYNFAIVLASVIPEILSRLCLKCSNEARYKLLEFLKSLYCSSQKHKFDDSVANLTKRLIASFSNKTLYQLLKRFLEFPILTNLGPIMEINYPEPFHYINIDRESLEKNDRNDIDDRVIDDLIQCSASNNEGRQTAVLRLVKLHELNLLNEEQVKRFSTVLWAQIEESSGFPINVNLYKFAFLKLPHPESVDPAALFQGFIFRERFPIQGARKDTEISIPSGRIPLCYESWADQNSVL